MLSAAFAAFLMGCGGNGGNDAQPRDSTQAAQADTLVGEWQFPDVTFHYRIAGDTIMLDPVITDGCSTFRCMWSVSVAYPGKKWKRVG